MGALWYNGIVSRTIFPKRQVLFLSMSLSFILIICALALIFFILRRQSTRRIIEYGPVGLIELRTDLPLDDCLDRLDAHSPDDVFAYECRREADGGFTLHLTMHQPTSQPLDTLYALRLEAGRQTVVTLLFRREAFGYAEPVFPAEMLDAFLAQKLSAHRTK